MLLAGLSPDHPELRCSSLGTRLVTVDPHCNQGHPGPQVRSPRANSSSLSQAQASAHPPAQSTALHTFGRTHPGCGARLHVGEGRTHLVLFLLHMAAFWSLSSVGTSGIRCLLSAVSITPVHLSSQGQRSQPFMSWASSPWTRALPHGPHPQQDTGNKGPQERCPFLTKPGIPDDFDIIQIPFGMSPVDSQGPSSLSSPAGTLPVLQSQTYTTREGLGRPHGEGQQRGKAW